MTALLERPQPRPAAPWRAHQAHQVAPPGNAPAATIRVAVADDQALVRAGFRSLLELESDFQVVGEAGTGADAVRLVAAQRPDVMLMDVRMPVLDGIEATRQITCDRRLGRTAVIVISTFDMEEYVYGAIGAGARGFLLKDIEPGMLALGVRAVACGGSVLSPCVARRLLAECATRLSVPPDVTALGTLTERETEVLRLIAQGLSNDEIANRLVISLATAKTHVSRILGKLDARDRAQLVRLAYEWGVVTPGWLG